MDTRIVTAHLSIDLAEKLDDIAERLNRPRGWVIEKAIASYVALEEQRNRWTLEALADVDADRTIDHAQVELWAKSLHKPKPPRRSQIRS